MPPMNKMSNLLSKLERRLGTASLHLPDELGKEAWAKEVIANETLDTFSRYFPNQLIVQIDSSMRRSDGYYVLDKYLGDNIELLGVKDIDWPSFTQDSLGQQAAAGFGLYSVLPTDYSVDDIMAVQMRADLTSMFNSQIYVDYKPPNLIRLSSVFKTDVSLGLRKYPVALLIKHASNLMTIPPTMMETFEDLAEADVARFLYENLKYFEGLETAYANIDIRLSDLESKASKREDIVQKLDDAHVSFTNKNQPMIWTV